MQTAPWLSITPAAAARGRAHGGWLWGLAAVFALRVVAQPLALVVDTSYLPPFDAWHSGALPYPLLLAGQIVILVWLVRTAAWVSRGSGVRRPHRRAGLWVFAVGTLYASSMLARLVLGATVLGDVRWFASPVPTVFHLGLAAYLLVYAHFHYRHG